MKKMIKNLITFLNDFCWILSDFGSQDPSQARSSSGVHLAPVGAFWGSWGFLGPPRRSWEALGGLFGGSWGFLAPSWEPLGALLGRSWRLLSGLWLVLGLSWVLLGSKEALARAGAEFLSSQGGPLPEKWPWLEREQGFWSSPKAVRTLGPTAGVANWGGSGPPKSF